MFFKKKEEVVGIDIGSDSIKVIQLQEDNGAYSLFRFGMAQLEPEMIVDGAIMDSVRCVEILQKLIQDVDITARDAVISLSGHSVIVKKVVLPQMTEEELEESIKWEAEQYIPFDINDVNMDFKILNTFSDPEGRAQMNVLLAAVKKDKLTEYTSMVIEAGLNPVIVDIDAFALENMYCINYDVKENEIIALINIGASITNINVLEGGVFSFTRDISVGGNKYTESLQKDMGLSYEEAERAKKGEIPEDMDHEALEIIIDKVHEEIANEISRSFSYFKSTTGNDRIDKVMLSGGTALMKGLPPYLKEQLEIPVEIVNPFRKINIPDVFDKDYLNSIAPIAAVVVGLGIRRPNDR